MMRVADLLAPVPLERFESEFFGRQPLHIPAGGSLGKIPLGWERMNAMLGSRSHWTEANLKLILNSRPVQPDFYIEPVETLDGPARRADPSKVSVFLAMGASLVANSLEDISPDVRAISDCLSDHFSARAGANAYCSFEAIQAFASHCDLHEVFAIQCEGEKVWRIYRNRAAAPVAPLAGDDAQALIDRVKGPVLMEVRMRPGDLLYIPRGFYHDALATDGPSLHVTFDVAPLTGRFIFRLLEDLAIEDVAFRNYLPDARSAAGDVLADHLAQLAERVSALMRSSRFAVEIGEKQRRLVERTSRFQLPQRQALTFYARTSKAADAELGQEGLVLNCAGQEIVFGWLSGAVEWMLDRRGFSIQELEAAFQHVDRTALHGAVEKLEGLDLVRPYAPKL